jgi:hypothetical protein
MRRVDLTKLKIIGFGSFFATFKLSKIKVIKIPVLYDSKPVNEMNEIAERLGMSLKDLLVFDAVNGSRLDGALPILEIVEAESPNKILLGIIMPYATKVEREDIVKFVSDYPHWNWDVHPDNFGKYKNKVVRVDTQTQKMDRLFTYLDGRKFK